jgi:succinyl-CoA synthetase beta subunit
VAYTEAEAVEIAKELGPPVVVKAQIHAGGRGKGGGVKLARTVEEAEAIAKAMLGMTLRTHQTGPEGRVVRRLLIEDGLDLAGAREMYPRPSWWTRERPAVFHGLGPGPAMDIEEVAAKDPEAILKEAVNAGGRLPGFQAPQARLGWGCPPPVVPKAVTFMQAVYKAFEGTDASLLEIKPVSHDEGREAPGPRRQGQLRRQRALPARPSCRSCATSTRRTRSRWTPASHGL